MLDLTPNSINGYALSEAGHALYVAHGPREADIWLAELKPPDGSR